LSSLLLFLLCFWTFSFGIKFEEAKIIFLHALKAPRCSGNLQVSSQIFSNTKNLIQVIKISSQLFLMLLPRFVEFLCNQIQAWILNKLESIFENQRRFLFTTYPKKIISHFLHNKYYLGAIGGTLRPIFHNFARP